MSGPHTCVTYTCAYMYVHVSTSRGRTNWLTGWLAGLLSYSGTSLLWTPLGQENLSSIKNYRGVLIFRGWFVHKSIRTIGTTETLISSVCAMAHVTHTKLRTKVEYHSKEEDAEHGKRRLKVCDSLPSPPPFLSSLPSLIAMVLSVTNSNSTMRSSSMLKVWNAYSLSPTHLFYTHACFCSRSL